jgi:hypothetical protein
MAGAADIRKAWSEADIRRILHAYLLGAHGGVSREHTFKIGTQSPRIDFRFGDRPHGANPCVFELAVRGHSRGNPLSAGPNKPELKKLSRFPKQQANGGRVLLLLDLEQRPVAQKKLQRGYNAYKLGPGRFTCHSVRVLYVHRDDHYSFLWRPRVN